MTLFIFSFAAAILASSVCFFLFRKLSPALIVLAYEKIGYPPPGSQLKNEWISPKKFEETLLWLRTHGFSPIAPGTLHKRTKLPKKPVLFAFMGGYQSFIKEIFPLLLKYKTPAVLFIPPDLIGTYNAWQEPTQESWQNLLTQEEVKSLQRSGLIHFGALSLRGEDLTLLSKENASYLVQESFFRLQSQLNLTPEAFAFWPAKKFDIKTAAEVLPNGFDLPVITPQIGLNAYHKQMDFLNVLQPAKNPWAARYTLWKHR